jgi:hypothetical protein
MQKPLIQKTNAPMRPSAAVAAKRLLPKRPSLGQAVVRVIYRWGYLREMHRVNVQMNEHESKHAGNHAQKHGGTLANQSVSQ